MGESVEYIAKSNTFVDGRLVRAGGKFTSSEKPSKSWKPVNGGSQAEGQGETSELSAKEVVEQIQEMSDPDKLNELKYDSRKTVAAAAEKRIAEVNGGSPGAS